MTPPDGVLSFCVVNDSFYAAPGRQQEARPIDGKFRFHGGNNVAYKGMAIMIPDRNITLCYFFNGETRYNLHGPHTDLFLRPKKRLYAHTGGVPLPAPPLGTGPTNLGASPLTNLGASPLTNPKPWGLSPRTNPRHKP